MNDVLPPRGPANREALFRILSSLLLDSAEQISRDTEHHVMLLKRLAVVEMPPKIERALLANSVLSHNSDRQIAVNAWQVMIELDPKWAEGPMPKFPPEMTIEDAYVQLEAWREKYDEAVKLSRAEFVRNTSTEWPAARKEA